MNEVRDCKKILCVRLDNMGDVLMSSPAFSALRGLTDARITLLSSGAGSAMAPHLPDIDDVIICNVPWVKNEKEDPDDVFRLVSLLKEKKFDAAVIFTVFSQNPLPAAMVLYLAGIPVRAAFCRENPYALLTHWIVEKEPHSFIRHQVRRDLDLVAQLGVPVTSETIRLRNYHDAVPDVLAKLQERGLDLRKPWIVLHPGVSEVKRQYPMACWIKTATRLATSHVQMVVTGSPAERDLARALADGVEGQIVNMTGELSLKEFIALISASPLVISVNTSAAHIAAAVQTPVVVLYALTNPQHVPWRGTGKVLLFDVARPLRSRNEILRIFRENYCPQDIPMIEPAEIEKTVLNLLESRDKPQLPEIISSGTAGTA